MFGGEFYPGGICVSSSFEVLLWDEEKKNESQLFPFPENGMRREKERKNESFRMRALRNLLYPLAFLIAWAFSRNL